MMIFVTILVMFFSLLNFHPDCLLLLRAEGEAAAAQGGQPAPLLDPGKCLTDPSLVSICVSVLQYAAMPQLLNTKCTVSSQFAFQSSILMCSKRVSNKE